MDMEEPENAGGGGGMSRDSSFFSVTSGGGASTSSSVYFTALEDVTNGSSGSVSANVVDSGGGGGVRKRRKHQKESKNESTDEISNSTISSSESSITLGEADSLRSSSPDNGGGEGSSCSSLSNNGENLVEVREDISRLCNAIAETDDPDRVKRDKIEKALAQKSLSELRRLAISEEGLISNALRTKAWPLLLSVSAAEISQSEAKKVPKYFPDVPEKIVSLVHLDVARVLRRFPPGLTDPQQDHLQSYLTNLICSVLQEKRSAYYYQGFHDISLTFLLVSISQRLPYLAYLCLNKMIDTNLAPYMEKSMAKTHDVIHCLFAIIEAENPSLYKKIVIDCKCPVAFCLPWVLTWFAHTLPHDTDVFRLYDYILGNQKTLDPPYLLPVFISACLVLRNSKEILENDELTDIASMHHHLAKLPSELQSQEPWLEECSRLMNKYKGDEERLMKRGVEIKAIQDRLWNEDTNNNTRRRTPIPRRSSSVLISVSRFLFVRHRWATVSVVILGTALLLQAKYGRGPSWMGINRIFNSVKEYAPERLKNVICQVFPDDGGANRDAD